MAWSSACCADLEPVRFRPRRALAAIAGAAGAAVPVNEVASAPRLRQTPSKLGQRQAKMLAESTRVLMPDRLTVEAKASAETDVLNPLQKHHTTHEIAAAWNVHTGTVYRDFVDEKGVVKLGSGSPRRRTRGNSAFPNLC